MKAEQTILDELLSHANQQFIVPLFQRTYIWGKKEWQDLYNDLEELLETDEGKNTHFLGSIVTIPIDAQSHKIKKFLLIDGQQRVTTLLILLTLIRNKTEDKECAEEILEYQLRNKFYNKDDRDSAYRLKPTQKDRAAFWALIPDKTSDELPTEHFKGHAITQCYHFFERKLFKWDLKKLRTIILHKLIVVSITLEVDENPYLVFESLNARGIPLSQADLVRNYFFMKIPDNNEQTAVFEHYWKPMQKDLGESLTEYIRHYLIAIRASDVKTQEVYITFKKHIEDSKLDIMHSLKQLAEYARYYHHIITPETESSPSIQRALSRLKRLEVTVSYPFIINCYHEYAYQRLDEQSFAKVLGIIENFVIRRYICNVPRQGLNNKFPNLYKVVKQSSPIDFAAGVAKILQDV